MDPNEYAAKEMNGQIMDPETHYYATIQNIVKELLDKDYSAKDIFDFGSTLLPA